MDSNINNKSSLVVNSSINKSSNNLAQMTNTVNKISNQNHKRTNSFTNMINNSNSNHNLASKINHGNFPELENSSVFINKNSLLLPTVYQQKGVNNKGIKAHHQHHHSMSSTLNSPSFHYPLVQMQPQQSLEKSQQSPSTNIDFKFSNYKV
jgi:hypothetical protein